MKVKMKYLWNNFKGKISGVDDFRSFLILFFAISFILVILFPFPQKTKLIFPLKNLWEPIRLFFSFWSRQYFLLFGTLAFFAPLIGLYYTLQHPCTLAFKKKFIIYALSSWVVLSSWFAFLGLGREESVLKGGILGNAIIKLLTSYFPGFLVFIVLLIITILVLHFIYKVPIPWQSIKRGLSLFADGIDWLYNNIIFLIKNRIQKSRDVKSEEVIKPKQEEKISPPTRLVVEAEEVICWDELRVKYSDVSEEEFQKIKKQAIEEKLDSSIIEGMLEESAKGLKKKSDCYHSENEIIEEIKTRLERIPKGSIRKDVVFNKTFRLLNNIKYPLPGNEFDNVFQRAIKILEEQERERRKLENLERNPLEKTEDILWDIFFIDYDYVSGMEKLKEILNFHIEGFLKERELITKVGGRSMKPAGGILLYGPPGCGKTYFARATAGEFNQRLNVKVAIVDLFTLKGSHWSVQMKKLNEIFQLIKKNAPCVVLWDEIDSFASDPAKTRIKYDREKSTILKQQLDGIVDAEKPLIHIATSNYPWLLEGALLRPGRFSIVVYVPPPDSKARFALIQQRLIDMWIEKDIDINTLVNWTEGNSIAEIKDFIDKVAERVIKEILSTNKERAIRWEDFQEERKILEVKSFKAWIIEAKNQLNTKASEGMKEYFQDILKY